MKNEQSRKTMDTILVILGIFLLLFILVMIYLFVRLGAIPDTLCTCVFAACGGECGIMGWIKTSKTRYQEREWEVQDREQMEKEEESDGHYAIDPTGIGIH